MLLKSVKNHVLLVPLLASVSFLPLMLDGNHAWGQDAQTDDATTIEEVTVTGSRIPRAGFDTMQPASVIDGEYLDARGFTNIADALNEGPQFSVSDATAVNRQGRETSGQNFANFFGLGTQRTLTLVNGRRFVSGNAPIPGGTPGRQVDLNNIPTGLVERIETIAIGGAPIYGSDAIAGTVNIILKDDFEGIEGDVQYGSISDQGGDAENVRTRLLMGGNFGNDRGNAVLSFEFNNIKGLIQKDRPDTALMQAFLSIPGAPNPLTLKNGLRFIVNAAGGMPLLANFFPKFAGVGIAVDGTRSDVTGEDMLRFAPDGSLTTFDMAGLVNTPFQSFGFGDGLALEERESLFVPSERFMLTGLAHYDITDWVTGRMELWHTDTRVREQRNQIPGFARGLFTDGEGGAFLQSLDNPFLRPEVREIIFNALTDPATGLAIKPGFENPFTPPSTDRDGDGIADSFYFNTRLEDLSGDGETERNANLSRFVFGLEGEIDFAGRTLAWDFSYNYGRSSSVSRGVVIFDALLQNGIDAVALEDAADIAAFQNFFSLRAAERVEEVTARAIRPGTDDLIGPDDVQIGDIVCAATLDPPPQPGSQLGIRDRDPTLDQCIPVNLFGDGNIHPEARNRIVLPSFNRTVNKQEVYMFNVTGQAFDLPGGPVGFAIGFEHREEFGGFDPDGLETTSFGRGVPATPASGGFNTDEFYGETLVPIISEDMEVPFVMNLQLEGAVRLVDNNLAGSNTTYTTGGRWTINSDITIRGNFTHSIRAPAILELFLPTTQIIDFANDPCDADFVQGGPIPGARVANCASDGIPVDFQSTIQNGSRAQTLSGDPDLQNEVADSWTVGAVYTPGYVPGLQLAVDWVKIDMTNAIENLDGTATMQACYDVDPGFFAQNPQCAKIFRSPAGTPGGEAFQVTNILTGFTNAGFSRYSGLQAILEYRTDVETLIPALSNGGTLTVTANYNLINKQELSITGFDLNDQKGELGRSKHRFNLNTQWDFRDFGMLITWRYIGKAVFDNNDAPGQRDVPGVGAWNLVNLSFNYQITDWAAARFIVNNVFDNNAPRGAALDSGDALSNGGQTTYIEGILGRRYTFGLSMRF